ncbi:MAG TPA: CPBP family intramembrane glutamic endopeptidase [Phycisphaerae bacterium]|nr:CPBP family intramembrane glutamic endopeptidase [Phycisphaerae bacterium]
MSDPLESPPVARPAVDTRAPQALDYAPLAKPVERRFPDLAMPASAAAIDLVIVTAWVLGIGALLLFSDLAEFLMEHWPSMGRLGTNLLLGLLNLGMVVAVLVRRRQGPGTIGLNRPPLRRLLSSAAIAIPACWAGSICGAMLYIALIGLDTSKVLAEKTELFDLVAQFPVAWILPFTLFVGIHEEVLFRGFFLSRMRALSRSKAAAVIVTGVVFGLLHFYQGLLGVFQTTMIGIFLAIIVVYARTLWPAIIAHAAFDATNMVLLPWVPWVLRMLKGLESAS